MGAAAGVEEGEGCQKIERTQGRVDQTEFGAPE